MDYLLPFLRHFAVLIMRIGSRFVLGSSSYSSSFLVLEGGGGGGSVDI